MSMDDFLAHSIIIDVNYFPRSYPKSKGDLSMTSASVACNTAIQNFPRKTITQFTMKFFEVGKVTSRLEPVSLRRRRRNFFTFHLSHSRHAIFHELFVNCIISDCLFSRCYTVFHRWL